MVAISQRRRNALWYIALVHAFIDASDPPSSLHSLLAASSPRLHHGRHLERSAHDVGVAGGVKGVVDAPLGHANKHLGSRIAYTREQRGQRKGM